MNEVLEKAARSCETDVAPKYSDWHYALRGLAAAHLNPVLGVLSFYQRINAIALRASERALALTQLQWWQTQVDSETDADGTHPCLLAMGELRQRDAIRSRLQRLLALAQEDLDFAGFATSSDMQRFFRTRGALRVELLALVQHQTMTPEAAANWGYFLEYVELLSQLPRQFSQGLIYFSSEHLAAHQLSADELATHAHDQQARLQQLLSVESAMARTALSSINPSTQKLLPFLRRYSALQLAWLNATKADGFRLFEHHLALGSLQKNWCCWRADWLGL